MKKLAAGLLTFAAAAAFAGATEVVVLKGGKTLELAKPYVVRGSQALMTLKDGTLISVAAADVDAKATAAARRIRPSPEEAPAVAVTPVEAAKAQQSNTKARVRIGDADVGHVLDNGDTVPAAGEPDAGANDAEGAARLEVVDFDQRPAGNGLAVKGTVRNSGKVIAEGIALTVAAIDDSGKTVATTAANVASGTLDPGSSATFTASLPAAVKGATLRFTPRWSSPAAAVKAAVPADADSTPNAAATLPKPAAPPPPPPAPPTTTTKTEYKPTPDYAPPPANAPMTAPDDNHYGYIPGAHEETPPPPPPPPPPPSRG